MLKVLLLTVLLGLALANICTDESGAWSYGIAGGVTDFAHVGVVVNRKYFCFEGCLNTGTVVQNYKVQLIGNSTNSVEMLEMARNEDEILKSRAKKRDDNDDPNSVNCIDPVLRSDIATALQKVTEKSCKAITKTLLFNLNRPDWVIACVKFNSFSLDAVYQDLNFCDYNTYEFSEVFNIRMAKVDMS